MTKRRTKTRARAKTPVKAKAARTRARPKLTDVSTTVSIDKLTHSQLTERFNALVPQASNLGITWARHHTSAFETKKAGVRMVAKLEEAIAAAKT
jgi:hypothetical protein